MILNHQYGEVHDRIEYSFQFLVDQVWDWKKHCRIITLQHQNLSATAGYCVTSQNTLSWRKIINDLIITTWITQYLTTYHKWHHNNITSDTEYSITQDYFCVQSLEGFGQKRDWQLCFKDNYSYLPFEAC